MANFEIKFKFFIYKKGKESIESARKNPRIDHCFISQSDVPSTETYNDLLDEAYKSFVQWSQKLLCDSTITPTYEENGDTLIASCSVEDGENVSRTELHIIV